MLRHTLSWLSRAYAKGDPVVERYDPAQGIMIVKAYFLLTSAQAGSKRTGYTPLLVSHLLILDTQPGQCRLSLMGFDQETTRQLGSASRAAAAPAYGPELKQQCGALLASFRRQWGLQ